MDAATDNWGILIFHISLTYECILQCQAYLLYPLYTYVENQLILKKGNHYLSVLIQTTQKNRPITFMYRMIHLRGADESSKSLRDYLFEALRMDEIYDVIKSCIVGIVTGNF